MPRLSVLLMALAGVSGSHNVTPSCGPWIPQTNGTYWRMCIDEQNQQYCESRSGRTIQRINCP
jgi:hypothetical protein